ncbi:MAG: hypothetical protein L0229_15815 [Blastocatellia bacterium]|nr:hypothetical protein [Blastocatellia bacterium]
MNYSLTFEAEPFEVYFDEEIALGRRSDQYEREFAISGSCTVYVRVVSNKTLRQFRASRPRSPGIYFIHVNGEIWYVGKAESKYGGIWGRFRSRALALKDLGFKAGDLTPRNIRITWLIPTKIENCGGFLLVQRKKNSTSLPNRQVTSARQLIPVLEQYFIKKHNTHLKGNYQVEPVTLLPNTAITIKTTTRQNLGTISKSFDLTGIVKARRDQEDIFDAEVFEAPWHSEMESETKITIDSIARQHLQSRAGRFPDPSHLRLIQSRINKLLGMNAPPEAVGNYSWYVEVPGVSGAKIILRDNMIRTVLSGNERYPANAVLYKIESGRLVRA